MSPGIAALLFLVAVSGCASSTIPDRGIVDLLPPAPATALATPAPANMSTATPTRTPPSTPGATTTSKHTPTPSRTTPPIPPAAPVPATGFVQRRGSQLLLDGRPFRFDGLNIFDANATSGAQARGANGVSLDQTLNAIGPGQEVFRAWFFQPLVTINRQRDWTPFDHTLAIARAHGARVIFVLADQWGHCDGEAARPLAWYQAGYRTQVDPGSLVPYRQWVAQAVARYADSPTVAFWQLVNEGEARNPDGSCSEALAAQALRAFADDVGGLIRSIDHHHLIGLGTIPGEC